MAGHSNLRDSFRLARKKDCVLPCPFQGETLPMILRHADVREAAKDWETYSSDAPFRVPIPSEEEVRTMRRLPIETNPPEDTEYRAIVEPFFQRARRPDVIGKVEALIGELLSQALGRESIEIVKEFALPVQSRALTYLLNVPESEADTWIGWGIQWRQRFVEKGLAGLEDALRPGAKPMRRNCTPFWTITALIKSAMLGWPNTRTSTSISLIVSRFKATSSQVAQIRGVAALRG